MNKQKYITIFALPCMWLAYFLFELFTGRVKDLVTLIGNLLFLVLFAAIGYFAYSFTKRYEKGLSTKAMWIFFFVLMIIDQGIKIIIKFFYFHKYVSILDGFISFNPIINTDGSWLNARFGTGVSFPLLILLNFIALFIFIEIYRYSKFNGIKDIYSDLSILFIFSGALCSLIDKVFYGGSLDFIGVGDLFIADIKDIYINLGIFFLLISLYYNGFFKDDDSSLKEDMNSLKRFFSFIGNDFKRKVKKDT